MRKAARGGRIETDERQKLLGASKSLCRRNPVRNWPVGDDPSDAAARVERGKRILENHLDVFAC